MKKLMDNNNNDNNDNINKEKIKYNFLLNKFNKNVTTINSILSKHNNVLNKKHIKLINSKDKPSKNIYTYNLDETIKDVYKIKLNSYDIPNFNHNININNNKLKFELGEEIEYDDEYDNIILPKQINNTYGEIIIIEYGNYTLLELVNYINSLCESTKIYAELINKQLHIRAIDFEHKKQYKLKILKILNIIIDDNFQDTIIIKDINLVYDKYVKLYIKNISNDEIGYLSLNNLSNIEYELNEIETIDNLEIEIKTLNDEIYDCNNKDTYFEFLFYSKIEKEELLEY